MFIRRGMHKKLWAYGTVQSQPVNVFALMCSLYVYGPRATRGDTTRECCSSCQPHPAFNHWTWMFRWVQAAHLVLFKKKKKICFCFMLQSHDSITLTLYLFYIVCVCGKLSWIQGEKVCFMCTVDVANTLHVTDLMRTELVQRGLYLVAPDFTFSFLCIYYSTFLFICTYCFDYHWLNKWAILCTWSLVLSRGDGALSVKLA